MVKLLSEHFNICNNSITNILQANNIRINQRLLLEKDVIMNKPELKKTNNTKTNNNEELEAKLEAKLETKVKEAKLKETKLKETKVEAKLETKIEENKTNNEIKPARGRGRPRKNTIMKEEEEEEICVEVEEIEMDGVTYYKTSENVILSKELEIEGIIRNGKIVKGVR